MLYSIGSLRMFGKVIAGLFGLALIGGILYNAYPAQINAILGNDTFDEPTPPTVGDSAITPTVKPSLIVSGFDEREIASLIHELVNEERAVRGLEPLTYDSKLASVAEAHSADMISRHYFDHVSPTGQDHRDRYKDAGLNCLVSFRDGTYDNGSENLMYGTQPRSEENIAKSAVEAWMESTEGHRENLLRQEWESEGIGVAINGNEYYVTQNFCG